MSELDILRDGRYEFLAVGTMNRFDVEGAHLSRLLGFPERLFVYDFRKPFPSLGRYHCRHSYGKYRDYSVGSRYSQEFLDAICTRALLFLLQ